MPKFIHLLTYELGDRRRKIVLPTKTEREIIRRSKRHRMPSREDVAEICPDVPWDEEYANGSIRMTRSSIVAIFALAFVAPFLIGCITHLYILQNCPGAPRDMLVVGNRVDNASLTLPSPRLSNGKKTPNSKYSSKTFHAATLTTTRSSCSVHLELDSSNTNRAEGFIAESNQIRTNIRNDANESEAFPNDDEICLNDDDKTEVHLPTGQHLLVDIKNVDPSFLNSEEQLSNAMVELINESKLTLLSYHCHSLVPVGVSCVGILLESHISLHTWPLEGVISLDVYTCGSGPLLPLLPSIERLFSVSQVELEGADNMDNCESPKMLWSHKLRGFRQGFDPTYERRHNFLDQDLGTDILSKRSFDLKRLIASKGTDFQHVDIYEVLEEKSQPQHSYEKSLSNDGSYESLHPELYKPDRILYLDGQLQSSMNGEAVYHEALVHPAMITHPNPKRVAIIGGGEGATLREVLKHETVEKAVMLEVDEENVEILRNYLPEWSNCSDFSENSVSCFEDSRAEIFMVDASEWFVENFGNLAEGSSEESPFDVIIMDALDPDDGVDFAYDLYTSSQFIQSLMSGLTENGILVAQLGRSPKNKDPADEVGGYKVRAGMMKMLEKMGFESMHVYDEGHSEFGAPWSYLVAFKDYALRRNWYRNCAEIDIQLKERIRRTKSGNPALKYFEAPTMIGYQVPPRPFETNYCRQEEEHSECDEIFQCKEASLNVPREMLQVRKSSIGENAGRGLFVTQDIKANACIAVGDNSKSFHVLPASWSLIDGMNDYLFGDERFADACHGMSALTTFINGYGYYSDLLGAAQMSVDSSIEFFMNHGCNGTYNYGTEYSSINELNAEFNRIPSEYQTEAEVYSPVIERHLRTFTSGPEHTLRDIKAGEEILANYLAFISDEDEWMKDVLFLRGQCAGDMIGEITEYEKNAD